MLPILALLIVKFACSIGDLAMCSLLFFDYSIGLAFEPNSYHTLNFYLSTHQVAQIYLKYMHLVYCQVKMKKSACMLEIHLLSALINVVRRKNLIIGVRNPSTQ